MKRYIILIAIFLLIISQFNAQFFDETLEWIVAKIKYTESTGN